VAADLAALGAVPVCIGIVGDDANGRVLREALAACGADVSDLLALADHPTTTKQRLIGLAQHRHKQQLMRIDEEASGPLPLEVGETILQRFRECLTDVQAVCLQDYGKGLVTPALCQQIIGLARGAGRTVLADPAFGCDYTQYNGASVLTPNRREAAAAVGMEIETSEDAAQAAEHLRKDLALEAAVITLDKEGAYLAADGVSELIPARARTVYDVTGAGDMVLATIAVSLAADGDYVSAVHLANIAGGIEVEKFGAATVTVSEMIHEIAERYGTANTKVRSLAWVQEEIKWRRGRGQTIVFTNGCFDVLHRGHIEYLQFCRDQGDLVVVGLNSDRSVRALKGPDRPVNSEHDRAAVLAGLESVDFITIFDDPSVRSLVAAVRPDVLVKGGDWGGKEGVVGYDVVEAYGGKVVLAPLIDGKSSTATIERIRTVRNQA
jgi:D-beta-D-heptose 7-phosphate kinase/D-beta-D-heptose 1-phosphate adenosyltransferase